ncbi:glycosyltransferase family 39 protein [Allorhodopirellula solitaria]|uniref:Glycosyltransferase RgtA/B/C/D-like domain-containing protein n=1 Tax=Allorhodopirellula solitaria TaxID=2527987 RepID=A0A5C5WZM7_9BACT|nr:glycosyltransferase family 39 protein [Allorhodopirellula solitaria]TWT56374.1 hypothetical protein CA85_41870 [Allorhodopirellula solitaria]
MLPSRRLNRIFLFALSLIQLTMLLVTAWWTGPGWDEWGHLPSGLFSLQYGDFHPYRVNPPLIRLLSAIPVALLGGGMNYEIFPKGPGVRSEVFLGLAYIRQQGPDIFYWMSIARTGAIPIAIFGTFLIEKVGRRLGGPSVGLFAATLWVFSPMVIAYAATITPDVGATVFGFWATWSFYCWYQIGRGRDAVWLGISVAAALLSKSTWIVLPPLLLLMYLILCHVSPKRHAWSKRWKQIGVAALLAWLLVHAVYDFRGMLRPIGALDFISQTLSGIDNGSPTMNPRVGNRFSGTLLGWIPVPLPAEYTHGIDVQKRDFEGKMRSYLMGEWKEGGWWYYYTVAWLVKVPLAFWLIVAVGSGLMIRNCCGHRRLGRRRMIGIFVMILPGLAVFVLVSSQTGFNHHLRYVLPAFPAVFLLAAYPIRFAGSQVRKLLVALLIWFALSSVSIVPRSYAYFGEIVGGWRNGHRYLSHSNLHWGQDLLAIRHWVREHPKRRPVYLLYSPSEVDFHRLGIDVTVGTGAMSREGPGKDGWWVVSIDQLLTEPNSWFLSRSPTMRLSESTTIYHVVDGQVKN